MRAPYFVVKRTWGNRYLGIWPMSESELADGPWVQTQKEAVKFKDDHAARGVSAYMALHGGDLDARVVKVVPRKR